MTKTKTSTATTATPTTSVSADLFASDAVIEREIKLPDGRKHTLYFRELSALEFKRHLAAEQSSVPKVRDNAAAKLIAISLVEPDGTRALSTERAAQLKPAVSGAIFMAILELNGVIPPAKAADATGEDDDEGN